MVNGQTLQQEIELENTVSAGAWLPDGLVTLRETSRGATEIQSWRFLGDRGSVAADTTLPGTPSERSFGCKRHGIRSDIGQWPTSIH